MFEYKRVRPLTNIPLACFKPAGLGRDRDMYELRVGATLKEGFFMVKLEEEEVCMASFNLDGDHAGQYLLGQIVPSPSTVKQGVIYYEIFVHGGSRDATAFCRSPQELLYALESLESKGTESLFGATDLWEASLDHPFTSYFVEHPQDLRFEMLYGSNSLTGDDHFGFGGFYE